MACDEPLLKVLVILAEKLDEALLIVGREPLEPVLEEVRQHIVEFEHASSALPSEPVYVVTGFVQGFGGPAADRHAMANSRDRLNRLLQHQVLDMADGFGRVEPLRANLGTIHDRVTTK